MKRRPDERHLLAHALGECAEPAVPGVAQLEHLQQVADPAPPDCRLEVVDRTEVVEVSTRRHALVQARHLGHQTDEGAHRCRVVGRVDAVDPDVSGGRQQHAGHAAQGGGLAGAVAPEQNKALPLLDLHAQVAQREHVAVALREAFDFEHG